MNNGQHDDNKYEDSFHNENEEKQQPFHIVHDDNTVKQAIDSNKISVFQAPKLKKKRKKRSILSTLLTILAASIIGILFGVGILQMFIVLNDQPAASETTPEVSQTAVVSDPERATKGFSMPKLSGFMVQAGVFSELENAEEWQLGFAGSDLPTLVWQGDQQYYLFTGIFETEEIARIKINEYKGENELFIKPWETAEKEVGVTDEEINWLTSFHKVWVEGLMTKETSGFSDLPVITHQSSLLNEIQNYIQENLPEGNSEQFYLDVMYLYEQIGKDI